MSGPSRSAAASGPWAVIVPFRNEALVLRRRIANLARLEWPSLLGRGGEPTPPHCVIFVDDGSTDASAALAAEVLEEAFPSVARSTRGRNVRALVLRNEGAPGKAGAVRTGLACARELGACFVALTDADVIVDAAALQASEASLAAGNALVCARQRFVASLGDEGTARDVDGGAVRPRGDVYDRATAAVRAVESRFGALFSVHGQWLCWRLSDGLAPTPGLAADDLDLMFQARSRGGRVALAPTHFYEVKTPGPQARAQGLRRARAYFQVVAKASERKRPLGPGMGSRLQWWAYRIGPRWFPRSVGVASVGLAGIGILLLSRASWTMAALGAVVLLLLAGFAARRPRVRRVLQLLSWMEEARRLPGQHAGDRWEMGRDLGREMGRDMGREMQRERKREKPRGVTSIGPRTSGEHG